MYQWVIVLTCRGYYTMYTKTYQVTADILDEAKEEAYKRHTNKGKELDKIEIAYGYGPFIVITPEEQTLFKILLGWAIAYTSTYQEHLHDRAIKLYDKLIPQKQEN